jgi:mono/diheme cytochrome c family protein
VSRFFVSWTVVGLIAISGLAFTLIAIVIARSPYTHGNLSPQGYDRTEIAYIGEEAPFDGLGLADPQLARTGDPIRDGALLFFQYGCASCHGIRGQGGVLGTDLDEASPSEIRREVRDGPEGMPAFRSDYLSDEDVEKIIAFLTSRDKEAPGATADETDGPTPEPGEREVLKGGSVWEKIIAFLRSATRDVPAAAPGE